MRHRLDDPQLGARDVATLMVVRSGTSQEDGISLGSVPVGAGVAVAPAGAGVASSVAVAPPPQAAITITAKVSSKDRTKNFFIEKSLLF